MRRILLALAAMSTLACVTLPPPIAVAHRPTDVLMLGGEWRGDFTSEDGQRGGTIAFVLEVNSDTASGSALLKPVAYLPALAGASAPMRTEARTIVESPMHFVSVTDGIVAGVVPAFFDADRLSIVQMTFVGRMRSWDVLEGTYVTLGTSARVEERGTWRVVRR
ncbi:MAG TPA: hypothetical protein VJ802_02335 [Gemmatimonadaceae bacterium]|nr:hypothetical protein [Gemmatimonadaceae bacterium]